MPQLKTYIFYVLLLLLALAFVVRAYADEPLKRAYHYNGDSMVRWGSIDVNEIPAEVKTERIVPVDPKQFNVVDAAADSTASGVALRSRNICTIHHMRKVITEGGTSWRCRK